MREDFLQHGLLDGRGPGSHPPGAAPSSADFQPHFVAADRAVLTDLVAQLDQRHLDLLLRPPFQGHLHPHHAAKGLSLGAGWLLVGVKSTGAFEVLLATYVLCVLVCVGSAAILTRRNIPFTHLSLKLGLLKLGHSLSQQIVDKLT